MILRPFFLVCPLMASVFSGCEKAATGPVVVTETWEISQYEPQALKMSSAERFGDLPFRIQVPATWTVQPTTQMRQLNYKFGPKGEGECYLTISPQSMGGVTENVNRWRGQMGQPPITENEVAKLPLKPFLGNRAIFVDVSGDYTGAAPMAEGAGPAPGTKADYRLLVMFLPTPQFTFVVKMVGPSVQVATEEVNFLSFCKSFQFRR